MAKKQFKYNESRIWKSDGFEKFVTSICIIYEIIIIIAIFLLLKNKIDIQVYGIFIAINCIITRILIIHYKAINSGKRNFTRQYIRREIQNSNEKIKETITIKDQDITIYYD